MEIVFCGTGWFPIVDFVRERLGPGDRIRARDPARSLAEELRDAEVVLPSNARFDRAAVEAPRRLRLIQQPAVGTDGIDLDAARALGIPVCNAPGLNGVAVAEAALLLMLSLARRVPQSRRTFASASIGLPLGTELAGKVLGVVGQGTAGTHLAQVGRGLGMQVLAVRSTSTPDEWDALWSRSDVVSLHCPLTPRTRGLVDEAALARMKRGAFLINCARGPIVDRAALERALSSGWLGGAGLDTFWSEPWDPSDPLFARDDVVTLPHVAGSTEQSFARIADVVADNIRRLARGDPLLNRIV